MDTNTTQRHKKPGWIPPVLVAAGMFLYWLIAGYVPNTWGALFVAFVVGTWMNFRAEKTSDEKTDASH